MKPDDAPENFWPQVGDFLSIPSLKMRNSEEATAVEKKYTVTLSCGSQVIVLSHCLVLHNDHTEDRLPLATAGGSKQPFALRCSSLDNVSQTNAAFISLMI